MLIALGMGAKRAIAASGAINWLLKDGVARLARMTVATNFGQSFDSDLKVGQLSRGQGAGDLKVGQLSRGQGAGRRCSGGRGWGRGQGAGVQGVGGRGQ